MTPEEIEKILQSNTKAIAVNSNMIAETRREINALYNICRELAQNTSELARDRAVMYEMLRSLSEDRAIMFDILRGLNEDRVTSHESLASIAESVAKIAELLTQQRSE